MYEIAYMGSWDVLPEAAAAICEHDIPKLEALLQGGLDLDIPVELGECIKLTPLEIAVLRNDAPMIRFLLERGANPDLAQFQPLLLTAARCCGPEVVAIFAGQAARLNAKEKRRALRKRAGASALRISLRWSKRALQRKSLAVRHSAQAALKDMPSLPSSC